MFNRPNRNDINDDTQDIRNDVSQLADTLEAVLKSGALTRRTKQMPRNVRLSLCCVKRGKDERPLTYHSGGLRHGQLRHHLRT